MSTTARPGSGWKWFRVRRKEKWRVALQRILFKEGDIVELAEQAEDEVED